MHLEKANPEALAGANRVMGVDFAQAHFDSPDLTEQSLSHQREILAAISVMRQCHVDFWHALTVCRLAGLGGAA